MTHPVVSFGKVLTERAAAADAIGLSEDDLHPDVPIQVASTGAPFVYMALKDADAVDAAKKAAAANASRREPAKVSISRLALLTGRFPSAAARYAT